VTQENSVLVVGSVAYDDLEMPTGTFKDVVDGAATYASISASNFAKVNLVGVVGDDFDKGFLDKLAGRGIDLAGVEHVAGGKTFHWSGRYSADLSSRETLDTQLNVFATFQPKILPAYKASPIVLLGNIHPALQLDVLNQVESPKLVVCDTMNLWIDIERATLGKVMEKVDLLVINDEEARQLSGIHNITKAAADIRKQGPKRLIIKRGEHGALYFDDAGVFFSPAFPLETVLDPTGAGDSFAGGLIGWLAKNGLSDASFRQAMIVASTMGSFCVEAIGTERLLSANRAAIAARLDAFQTMCDFGGKIPFHA
jgi:sugar/nucleoside kinase (ribokinase family)